MKRNGARRQAPRSRPGLSSSRHYAQPVPDLASNEAAMAPPTPGLEEHAANNSSRENARRQAPRPRRYAQPIPDLAGNDAADNSNVAPATSGGAMASTGQHRAPAWSSSSAPSTSPSGPGPWSSLLPHSLPRSLSSGLELYTEEKEPRDVPTDCPCSTVKPPEALRPIPSGEGEAAPSDHQLPESPIAHAPVRQLSSDADEGIVNPEWFLMQRPTSAECPPLTLQIQHELAMAMADFYGWIINDYDALVPRFVKSSRFIVLWDLLSILQHSYIPARSTLPAELSIMIFSSTRQDYVGKVQKFVSALDKAGFPVERLSLQQCGHPRWAMDRLIETAEWIGELASTCVVEEQKIILTIVSKQITWSQLSRVNRRHLFLHLANPTPMDALPSIIEDASHAYKNARTREAAMRQRATRDGSLENKGSLQTIKQTTNKNRQRRKNGKSVTDLAVKSGASA